MKSILVIGLGRFGKHLIMELNHQGHEILAVDTNEERVNEVLPYVTATMIGDCTNETFLTSLGIANFDLCFVAIGDNFQSSLETVSLLKENGARLVIARANRDTHAKFLLRNGADEVVYPESQMATRTAIRFGYDNVFDYLRLSDNYSIYETPVPKEWVGKSIIELNIRHRLGISVIALKQGHRLNPMIAPTHVFKADEELLVLGSNEDIEKYLKLS